MDMVVIEKNSHITPMTKYRGANVKVKIALGISQITPEQWRELALRRGLPPELSEPTLFASQTGQGIPPVELPATPFAEHEPEPKPADPEWLGRNVGDWLKR